MPMLTWWLLCSAAAANAKSCANITVEPLMQNWMVDLLRHTDKYSAGCLDAAILGSVYTVKHLLWVVWGSKCSEGPVIGFFVEHAASPLIYHSCTCVFLVTMLLCSLKAGVLWGNVGIFWGNVGICRLAWTQG